MEAGCNNIKSQGVLLNGYTRELGKVMITPVGAHDSTQEYDVLSLTYDANTRVSYISRKSVPAGTSLSDRNYWQPMNTNGAESQTQEELKALIEPIITDVITDGRYATGSEIDNKIAEALEGVQGSLTFDDVPTANSDNPVKSSGIKDYVDSHQVTTDAAPTQGSSNPVSSGGVYTALQGKQDTISDINDIRTQAREFSNSPAAGITSTNINSWNQAAAGGGTITGITMNGSSKGTSGVIDLGTVITHQSDWNETNTASDAFIQNKPAMPGIVQITRAEYKAKKDAGLLDQNLYYFIVDEEAEPIGFVISNESATGAVEKEIAPNVYYVWGELTSLTITFGTPATNKIINEYQFEFISGSTPTVLTLPSSVQWSNGVELDTSENIRYQVSIINNIGVWNSVPNM